MRLALALIACAAAVATASCTNESGFYGGCDAEDECIPSADACFEVAWEAGRNGGMCSSYCDVDADCPGEARCWMLVGDPMDQRICYKSCVDDFDCQDGFLCAEAFMGETFTGGICLPR